MNFRENQVNTLINSAYDSAAYTTIKDTSVLAKELSMTDKVLARDKKAKADLVEIDNLLNKYIIRVSKAEASHD